MIRRAALMKGTLKESISYHHASYPTLRDFVKNKQDGRDDVIAVSVALDKSKNKFEIMGIKVGKA